MAVSYLDLSEFAAYGVPDATTIDAGTASRVIDSYLDRPEGLIWTPGVGGLPAFMAELTPRLTLTLGANLVTGQDVTVPVANAALVTVGEVLIADRSVSGSTEALVVSAVAADGSTLTFQNVAHAHGSGAALDLGMVIETTDRAKRDGNFILPSRPAVRVLSAVQPGGLGYLTLMQASIAGQGHALISAGFASLMFHDLRLHRDRPITVRYLAGYPAANVPEAIKRATAGIVKAMIDTPELAGNVKEFQAGGTRVERWDNSLIDNDIRRLLGPFGATGGSFR